MGGGLQLSYGGIDGVLGTNDDIMLDSSRLTVRDDGLAFIGSYTAEFPPGLYEVRVMGVTDLVGNSLEGNRVIRFWITGIEDLDGDGIADAVEAAFGFDSSNPDTDGNGISDGDEDLDGDGLSNRIELALELDPRELDSDFDGVPDGEEDSDQDSLLNEEELVFITNPVLPDTDVDGWNDENEITVMSDPLDPLSFPNQVLIASPVTELNIPTAVFGGDVVGTVYGSPVVELNLPKPQGVGSGANGIVYGRPAVELNLPAPSERAGGGSLSAYGRPVVELNIPAISSGVLSATKTQMGRPEVIVIIGDDLHIQ